MSLKISIKISLMSPKEQIFVGVEHLSVWYSGELQYLSFCSQQGPTKHQGNTGEEPNTRLDNQTENTTYKHVKLEMCNF